MVGSFLGKTKNESDGKTKVNVMSTYSKTAREWILSSALYDGIEDEDIRQIETLLKSRGANPNLLLAEYGIAPFHLVVANESTSFAIQATDICIKHGADPNVRSEDGLTPVHLATMWGCQEVLRLLLVHGGDPWLVDSFCLTAFDYALNYKQQECFNILQAHVKSQHQNPFLSLPPYQLNLKSHLTSKRFTNYIRGFSITRDFFSVCVNSDLYHNSFSFDEWERFLRIGEVMLAGFFYHYIPFFFVERTLFLHHYLPAFIFKVLLLASLIEHISYIIGRWPLARVLFFFLLLCFAFSVLHVFRKFCVLSYGTSALSASDVMKLRWKDSWDFIVHV